VSGKNRENPLPADISSYRQRLLVANRQTTILAKPSINSSVLASAQSASFGMDLMGLDAIRKMVISDKAIFQEIQGIEARIHAKMHFPAFDYHCQKSQRFCGSVVGGRSPSGNTMLPAGGITNSQK
jgi:hypothetical protein